MTTTPVTTEWAKQFGSSSSDYLVWNDSTISDGKGGVFVAGQTDGSINGQPNNGQSDVFIANYNGNGDQVWAKQFGSSSWDSINSIISDGKGGVFVTGQTNGSINGQINNGQSDVFIANYNANGEEVWTKQFGSSSGDYASSTISDGKGGLFVTGQTEGSINGQIYNGQSDVFIASYSGNGDQVWAKQFGSSSQDYTNWDNSIISDGNGGVFVTGQTNGSINGQTYHGESDVFVANYNANGEEVWTKQLGSSSWDYANSTISDSNGGFFVSGQTNGSINGQNSNGQSDVFIANYNANGEEVWTKQFGSSSGDYASSTISDEKGGLFVTGQTEGSINGQTNNGQSDVFIANYSGNGDQVWAKQFGSSSWDSPSWRDSTNPDGSGGVFVTGQTNGSINGQTYNGESDVFVTNYNANGEEVWTKQLGSSSWDYAISTISDSNGGVFVTGQTDGNINGQANNGQSDVFIAKFGSVSAAPVIGSDSDNSISITGTGSGTADGSAFSNIQSIDLKGGNDTATISTAASLAGLLNGGSGTDTLIANASNNSVTINASSTGTVDGTSFSNFETINTLAGNDSVTVNNSSTALTLNTGEGIDSLTSTVTTAEALNVSGANTGTLGSIGFSELENVNLGSGNDTASISTTGSLTSLNAGSGTDTLNASASNNTLTLNASGSGSVDGTSISNFETVNLLVGDDSATVDLMNPATAAMSLVLNGGAGNDALDIKLSDAEFAKLENTDALEKLSSYLADPNGKSLDIGFGEFALNASGFESASINHDMPFTSNPLKLNSVAASASDKASASGLEGLNLDVGGVANIQTPVTLKSTSDVSTVEGNVKSDAHATEVLGISASTLHAASDLSVGSALQSIVSGSAESTNGIAIANALVDTQHR